MKKLKVLKDLMSSLEGYTVQSERLSTNPMYVRTVVTLEFNNQTSTEPFYETYLGTYKQGIGSVFNHRAVLVMQRYLPLKQEEQHNLLLPFSKVAVEKALQARNVVVLKGTFQNPFTKAMQQPKPEHVRREELK